jgi:nitroreductase
MEPCPRSPRSARAPEGPHVEVTIGRRRFLVMAGSAAALAALRPRLAWAGEESSPAAQLQAWTLPGDPPATALETARALIAAAVLAPSNWNSQPWRFEVEGTTIRLVADTSRSLPITDPDQKGMMISLGAALENMLVAARAYGLRPKVTYFPHGGAASVVAEVAWVPGEPRRDRLMFGAIVERRTNRRDFDGRAIFMQNRAQLTAQASEGFRLHWLDDDDAMNAIADIASQAVHTRVADRAAEAETYGWMRFGDEAERRGDGVTVDALEYGGFTHWFAGRYFNPGSWFLRFGAQSAAKEARSAIRSAGALALLTAARGGAQQWVAGGQTFERLALRATQLGIAHQPINTPIEMEPHRGDVLERFGVAGEEPLMLLRLGHANPPPAAARRAVAMVASFRNS